MSSAWGTNRIGSMDEWHLHSAQVIKPRGGKSGYRRGEARGAGTRAAVEIARPGLAHRRGLRLGANLGHRPIQAPEGRRTYAVMDKRLAPNVSAIRHIDRRLMAA